MERKRPVPDGNCVTPFDREDLDSGRGSVVSGSLSMGSQNKNLQPIRGWKLTLCLREMDTNILHIYFSVLALLNVVELAKSSSFEPFCCCSHSVYESQPKTTHTHTHTRTDGRTDRHTHTHFSTKLQLSDLQKALGSSFRDSRGYHFGASPILEGKNCFMQWEINTSPWDPSFIHSFCFVAFLISFRISDLYFVPALFQK